MRFPRGLWARVVGAFTAVPGLSSSAIGNYAMVGGQVLRTLIVARLLGVQQFGVLNLANVTANLTALGDVGTSTVGNQKASEARGRGDLTSADTLQHAAGGARMFPSLLLGTVVALAAIVLAALGHQDAALAAGFVALSAPLQGAWFALREYLRVRGEFLRATRAQLFQVALWVTAVPLAAWKWGLAGAFVAIAASFLAPILASAPFVPLRRLLTPRWGPFRTWFRLGLPIWLGLLASFAYTNIDQFVIGALLGAEAVGIFAIGLLVSTALVAFSDGAAAAAHPQTLEFAAREGGLTSQTPSVWRTMRISQAVLGLLVPMSWLGLVVVTTVALPAYEGALAVVAILGPAAAAVGVATASNATLLATGRHRLVPVIFLAATTFKTVLALLVFQVWPDIRAFALTALLGSMVFLLTYLWVVAGALGVENRLLWGGFHLISPASLAALGGASIWALDRWGVVGFATASAIVFLISMLLQYLLWRAYARVVHAVRGGAPTQA